MGDIDTHHGGFSISLQDEIAQGGFRWLYNVEENTSSSGIMNLPTEAIKPLINTLQHLVLII